MAARGSAVAAVAIESAAIMAIFMVGSFPEYLRVWRQGHCEGRGGRLGELLEDSRNYSSACVNRKIRKSQSAMN